MSVITMVSLQVFSQHSYASEAKQHFTTCKVFAFFHTTDDQCSGWLWRSDGSHPRPQDSALFCTLIIIGSTHYQFITGATDIGFICPFHLYLVFRLIIHNLFSIIGFYTQKLYAKNLSVRPHIYKFVGEGKTAKSVSFLYFNLELSYDLQSSSSIIVNVPSHSQQCFFLTCFYMCFSVFPVNSTLKI